MELVTGGCLCGRVRIAATGQPLRVGICHCRDCRKHHGAIFYAAAIYDCDAVKVSGETQDYMGRHFCATCGSSVFAVTGAEFEFHLGAADDPDAFVPQYECWIARRESWLPPFAVKARYPKDTE